MIPLFGCNFTTILCSLEIGIGSNPKIDGTCPGAPQWYLGVHLIEKAP